MVTFEGLQENLKFILVETQKQVAGVLAFLRSGQMDGYTRMLSRDDYIDNLKVIIENQCYSHINQPGVSRKQVNDIRAMQIISSNLERIADHCLSILGQTQYLGSPDFINKFNYEEMLERVIWALGKIDDVLLSRDLGEALAICKVEDYIDGMYKVELTKVLEMLRLGRDVEDLVTTIFILKYIERTGDAVLNIGEALIFSIIGEKIKIQQFNSLSKNLGQTGLGRPGEQMGMKSFWGTRSGCRISKVGQDASEGTDSRQIIFKEGSPKKILAEKRSLDEWDKLCPGLVSKVLSSQEGPESASILIEFLNGYTLDEIFLNSEADEINEAVAALQATLLDIWGMTRKDGGAAVDYMHQMAQRMESVLEVHPEFSRYQSRMGESEVRSTRDLLVECAKIERGVIAPFSVRIHGDCNVSNVLYDFEEKRVHFIDLYRSGQADYVQDISVFIVSNFRIPVFERSVRDRLNAVIRDHYAFGQGYARDSGDAAFQFRLALALSRSFYTSTRFELNHKFAKEMFLRAHYLMEKVVEHTRVGGGHEGFVLPEQILYY